MYIGIDLDEVLADFMSALIDFHNCTYGTSFTKNDFHSCEFHEVWGGTQEEAIQKVYDFHKTAYSENMQPVAGSVEGVENLKRDGHTLSVITSRQYDFVDLTKNWLQKYFPDKFSNIHFTNSHSQNGVAIKKSEICSRLNVGILIDDRADNANECAMSGTKVFLLDYPWNRNANLLPTVTRVKSWQEIIKSI